MKNAFKQYFDLLIKYLKPQSRRVVQMGLLLFTSIGLQLLGPQIIRYFIDTVVSRGAIDNLARAALFFILVVFARQLASALATYLSEDVGWTATNSLRTDLVLHCLGLDISFHKAHTPGELIERIDGDVMMLSNLFSQFVFRVLGSVILLLGILTLAFIEDWRVGLMMTVSTLIALYVLRQTQGIAIPHHRAFRQSVADTTSFWEEALTGTEDIRANGAKAYTARRHAALQRLLLHNGRKSMVMARVFFSSWEFLVSVANAALLAIGAYLLNAGAMTIGGIYLVFQYGSLLSTNLLQATEQMENLQQATASVERIRELLSTGSRIKEGDEVIPHGPLSVEFKDVSFTYTANRSTLEGVSFRIEPGKVLGVLGRTGSGKTTLIRLLFRLYDTDSGTIRLGDVDIRCARLSDLRQRVGFVTQEVELFHASLRDNLTFFDDDIPDKRIIELIAELGLADWYALQPRGLDTVLEAGDKSLSAGEAQLVAFIRVFLKDPGLVILDEAFSRVDPATERMIARAIDKLLEGRTGIIIAHRLATVERSDCILILEGGRVREYGSRDELMMDSTSHYSRSLNIGLEEVLA